MSLRPVSSGRRLTFPHMSSTTRELERLIHERITSRLGRRIRNLAVAVDRGVIHLAGQCSTYYSKQLAQHVVLGVVEDEVIDNEIEVSVPRTSSNPNY
ncbi:hypothetical protein Pla108_00140 [Botrimarina colliarenosi]|uniref:BON domain protein n=1 Tax=Botrimarina colliarenosi TaxID=2528001 RepID=A0A5C6AJ41_9BACT|nr:BON domain-containing protein [Botrimarina colliarenosi]TWT99081.1 hypothetical protein Pla108_00140 [Botrimarina colliarenosi]